MVAFLRVVEVFPPLIPVKPGKARVDLDAKIQSFVEEVRRVRSVCDLVLVANLKNPAYHRVSAVEAASLIQARAGVPAAPTIVARDENRFQLRSTILTAMALGLGTIMLAWGDRYPAGVGATNVRDYRSLAEVIEEGAMLSRMIGRTERILAPVDLRLLPSKSGRRMSKSRLKAGAELLLAQPPTTDAKTTLQEHLSVLERSGLMEKVLLNVFPFR